MVADRFAQADAVTVRLGNGDGTFGAARTVAGTPGVVGIAVGDVDHDGRLDLATSAFDPLSVLLGNGDGTFRSSGQSFTAGLIFAAALVDVNGDSWLDILATNVFSVGVLLGRDPRGCQ